MPYRLSSLYANPNHRIAIVFGVILCVLDACAFLMLFLNQIGNYSEKPIAALTLVFSHNRCIIPGEESRYFGQCTVANSSLILVFNSAHVAFPFEKIVLNCGLSPSTHIN